MRLVPKLNELKNFLIYELRGLLRENYRACIVIFDLKRINE